MKYPPPTRFHLPPVALKVKSNTTKITVIIIGLIVTAFLTLGAIGLGLGLGFQTTADSTTSKLVEPAASSSALAGQRGSLPITALDLLRIISQRTTTTALPGIIIQGGTSSGLPNAWPWIAALYSNNTKICSGFLITNRHIITAATCVHRLNKISLTVYLGISTLSKRHIAQTRSVSTVTYPSTFKHGSTIDNIAVLTLNTNVTLTSTTALCPIPKYNNITIPLVNQNGVVAGWNTSSSSAAADILQQVDLTIAVSSTCGIPAWSNSQFCGQFGSVNKCLNERGSPLMTNQNNVWTCSGVTSGVDNSKCSGNGIYTRVSFYSAFISNATRY